MPRGPRKTTAMVELDDAGIHYTAQEKFIIRKMKEVLGEDRHVTLVSSLKPHRAAQVATFGYLPVRWSDLDEKQRKVIEPFFPFKPDDVLRYGDTIVVSASMDAYHKREARRHLEAMTQEERNETLSAATQLRKDLDAPVTDEWADLGESHRVGGSPTQR